MNGNGVMMYKVMCLVLLVFTLNIYADDKLRSTEKTSSVKVAAIQAATKIGKINYNRKLLVKLISKAAKQGAKIIVLPECSLQGYMDINRDIVWAEDAVAADSELPIEKGAITIDSPLIKYFSTLSKKLRIYLCLAFAEKAAKKYYNSQVLFNPQGKIIAHHRKKNLWSPGDGRWVTEGNKEVQVVDSEYGRLGLMICFDLHLLPPELAKKKTDIVLYSVGWYGPNESDWFQTRFPRDYIKPYHFSVILANWSAPSSEEAWVGAGFSTIYDSEGNVLSKAASIYDSEIIYADIPVKGGENNAIPENKTSVLP